MQAAHSIDCPPKFDRGHLLTRLVYTLATPTLLPALTWRIKYLLARGKAFQNQSSPGYDGLLAHWGDFNGRPDYKL